MQKTIKIGILGLGTVGGGVVNVLAKNQQEIINRCGKNIQIIIGAVKDKNEPRICNDNDFMALTENAQDVINSDADIILELIGGTTLAYKLVVKALESGKNVVTANKALIANYGNELLEIAKNNQVKLLFEAAVAGGIPVLKALEQGLSANKIDMIAGIINGTGNFILSKMGQENSPFTDVLTEAQRLGYAEADPVFDIEGIDAAHKLTILSSMAFGIKLAFDKVSTIGIKRIKINDIQLADELGFKIKHLAIAKNINNKIIMSVNPTLIPKNKLLANVDGVMNAIMIKGNAVGETMYYGAGAGSDATASSVIADIIDIINNTATNNILGWQQLKIADFMINENIENEFYLKICVSSKKDILNIKNILTNFKIKIQQTLQKTINNNIIIALITTPSITKNIYQAITKIEEQSFNQAKIQFIHIENLT